MAFQGTPIPTWTPHGSVHLIAQSLVEAIANVARLQLPQKQFNNMYAYIFRKGCFPSVRFLFYTCIHCRLVCEGSAYIPVFTHASRLTCKLVLLSICVCMHEFVGLCVSMMDAHAGDAGRWACEVALERGGGKAAGVPRPRKDPTATVPPSKETHLPRTAIYRRTVTAIKSRQKDVVLEHFRYITL